MKKKNYENIQILWFFIGIIILLFFFFILFLYHMKLNTYQVFSGVILKENIIELLVDKDQLHLLNSNKYFYMQNHKYDYKIVEVHKDVLKRKNGWYHMILLESKNMSDLKENDIVNFSIFNKKIQLIKMFKVIWEENLDGKT